MKYVTAEIRKLIGFKTPPMPAVHPVEASEVRRFHHATMDPARRYWDADWAAGSRYGTVVAPPAFPIHTDRRPPDGRDPLDAMNKADFDGLQRSLRAGLPPVDVPLTRLLNGGYDYEFYRYARIGEKILCTSSYKDIYERESKNGWMVFILIEDLYTNGDGEPLLRAVNTTILR